MKKSIFLFLIGSIVVLSSFTTNPHYFWLDCKCVYANVGVGTVVADRYCIEAGKPKPKCPDEPNVVEPDPFVTETFRTPE